MDKIYKGLWSPLIFYQYVVPQDERLRILTSRERVWARIIKVAIIFFKIWAADSVSANLQIGDVFGSLVIESDGMECVREKNTCIASGNVVVSKDRLRLKSDTLIATSRKTDEGKQEIIQVKASGNVRFKGDATEEGSAPYAFYDLNSSKLILSARASVHESLPLNKDLYPTLQKDQKLLRAEEITIYFIKSKDNKTELSHVEARGDVTLSTPEDIAHGDFATYVPQTKLATLRGHVVIDRHNGQISGSYAEVNLDTGISKMLNTSPQTKGSKGRVQILLKPKGLEHTPSVGK